jgi:hypothetical protein
MKFSALQHDLVSAILSVSAGRIIDLARLRNFLGE